MRVADGEGRVTQADHLIDGPAVGGNPHVGEPGGEIGGALPAEAVLRRDDEIGVVARFAARPHQLAGNHEMAALDKRRARSDDGDAHARSAYS